MPLQLPLLQDFWRDRGKPRSRSRLIVPSLPRRGQADLAAQDGEARCHAALQRSSVKCDAQRASDGIHSPSRWPTRRPRKTRTTVDQQLQQAVRTLRAIRQRYEAERNAGSGYVRAYNLQVALGYADMIWLTAAVEALEKVIDGGATEVAEAATQGAPVDDKGSGASQR